jgi:stage II sporulation protein M
MARKNKLSLKKQLNEAKKYVKESREQIYVIIALFFVSAVLGYVFSERLGFIEELLRQIISQIEGLNGVEITAFILQNNIKSAFFGMLFGFFFGIFPIFNAVGNGLVLGYVSNLVVAEAGFLSLWALIPHGIFELAGVFIALGMGLKLGGFLFVKKGKRFGELKRRLYEGFNAFLLIVIPLLVIAAIIEGILIALS